MCTRTRCSDFVIPGKGFVHTLRPMEVPVHYIKPVIVIDPHARSRFQTACPSGTSSALSRNVTPRCHTPFKHRFSHAMGGELWQTVLKHFHLCLCCTALHSVAVLLGPQLLSVPVPPLFFAETLPFVLPLFPERFSL